MIEKDNTCEKLKSKAKHIEDLTSILDKELKVLTHNTSLKLNSCEKACGEFLGAKEGPKLEEAMRLYIKNAIDTVASAKNIICLSD